MPETVCCTTGTPHLTWAEKEHKGGYFVHKGACGGGGVWHGVLGGGGVSTGTAGGNPPRPGVATEGSVRKPRSLRLFVLQMPLRGTGSLWRPCGPGCKFAYEFMKRRPGLDKAESGNPNPKAAHAGAGTRKPQHLQPKA
jgi:hypothetical protein